MSEYPLGSIRRLSDEPLAFVAERGTPWAGSDDFVALSEGKAHLRVTHDHEDTLITRYIRAARRKVEDSTRRSLLQSQWLMTLPRFPRGRQPITIPRPPLVSIDSVAYIDSNGDAQTLTEGASGYQINSSREPAQMFPGINAAGWPDTTADVADAVVVTFQAGFTVAADIPDDLVMAGLQLLGMMYQQREPTADANAERSIRYLIAHHTIPEAF